MAIVDMQQMRAAHARVKEKRRRVLKLNKELRAARKMPIDFSRLSVDSKKLSFDSESALNERMCEVLARSVGDESRSRLVARLSAVFVEAYECYRRMLAISLGLATAYEICDARDFTRCASIGVLCARHGVTPRALIEYWHGRMDYFGDPRLKSPTLGMLAAPGMVVQAGRATAVRNRPGPINGDVMAGGHHSFSDLRRLNPRLRERALAAGFAEVAEWDDRYLLSVQSMARSVGKGRDISYPGHLVPVVQWAAGEFFAAS